MCERYIDWLPLARTQLGNQPSTQACALMGNRTCDLLVHRPALNPLSHISQGWKIIIKENSRNYSRALIATNNHQMLRGLGCHVSLLREGPTVCLHRLFLAPIPLFLSEVQMFPDFTRFAARSEKPCQGQTPDIFAS